MLVGGRDGHRPSPHGRRPTARPPNRRHPTRPVTSTRSPVPTAARVSRFSAVDYEHGNEASSTSVSGLSIRVRRSRAGRRRTRRTHRRPPSRGTRPHLPRRTDRTSTARRAHARRSARPSDRRHRPPPCRSSRCPGCAGTRTIRSTRRRCTTRPECSRRCCSPPAAPTRRSTSPGPGCGTATSSRTSSRSYPPCPVSRTARMRAGRGASAITLVVPVGDHSPAGAAGR